MITSEAVLEDYEAIVKEPISADEKLVKIFRIVLKLLLGIRTNQRGGVIAKKVEVKPTTEAK